MGSLHRFEVPIESRLRRIGRLRIDVFDVRHDLLFMATWVDKQLPKMTLKVSTNIPRPSRRTSIRRGDERQNLLAPLIVQPALDLRQVSRMPGDALHSGSNQTLDHDSSTITKCGAISKPKARPTGAPLCVAFLPRQSGGRSDERRQILDLRPTHPRIGLPERYPDRAILQKPFDLRKQFTAMGGKQPCLNRRVIELPGKLKQPRVTRLALRIGSVLLFQHRRQNGVDLRRRGLPDLRDEVPVVAEAQSRPDSPDHEGPKTPFHLTLGGGNPSGGPEGNGDRDVSGG
jgi:hypothetical protein